MKTTRIAILINTAAVFSILIIIFLCATSKSIFAQESDPVSPESTEKKPKSQTRFQIRAETGFEYNDNVFRLDDSQKSKMSENDSSDTAGGRFNNMESKWDFIVAPEARINIKTRKGEMLK